jgi:hypothetical protein
MAGAPNVMNFGQPIVVGTLASDPGTAVNGEIYYNSGTGLFRMYQNGSWQNAGTPALSNHNILVGNGSNVATAVDTSSVGGITIDSVAGLTINANYITNSMIAPAAGIARTKLASGTAYAWQTNNSSGVLQDTSVTASSAVATDSNGLPVASSTTATELGYVHGVTSAIQTQLNGMLQLAGGTMAGTINMNSNSITNLPAAVNPGDAVSLSVLQSYLNGVSWKTAVLVATTANITLSGEQTIDGFLTSASRVLVKNQSTASQNGIYVSGSGSWTRSTDMNAWSAVPGAAVIVQEGTVNADLGYVCTSAPGGTLGTTAITFAQFTAAGSYTADNVTLQLVSGVFSVKSGGISDTQISSSAAIQLSKLAALSTSLALVSNGSGVISVSTTTATELGYVHGVTSAIQTQINGLATTSLGNLASTAVNVSITPATDNAISLGTTSLRYINVAALNIVSGASDLTLNANSGSNNVQLINSGFKRGATSSRYVNQTYLDSVTLTGSSSAAVVAAFTVAYATIYAQEISYVIKDSTSNATRIGVLRVCTDGTTPSLTDFFNETADTGVTWAAQISGANLQITYTTTANNKVMRADIKQFLT